MRYLWLWVFPTAAYRRQPEPRLAFAPHALVLEGWEQPSFVVVVVVGADAVAFVGAVFHFVVVVVEAGSIVAAEVAAAANDVSECLDDVTGVASGVADEACWGMAPCRVAAVVEEAVAALAVVVEL